MSGVFSQKKRAEDGINGIMKFLDGLDEICFLSVSLFSFAFVQQHLALGGLDGR